MAAAATTFTGRYPRAEGAEFGPLLAHGAGSGLTVSPTSSVAARFSPSASGAFVPHLVQGPDLAQGNVSPSQPRMLDAQKARSHATHERLAWAAGLSILIAVLLLIPVAPPF